MVETEAALPTSGVVATILGVFAMLLLAHSSCFLSLLPTLLSPTCYLGSG
jgi:hypothetical protein